MIFTLAIGLTLALILGIGAQKLQLSPLVGYLLAGILAAQPWWGVQVEEHVVEEFSHIGVVLLLFGVGLQFHFKDLLAVQRVAVPGAVVCMLVRAALGAVCYYWLVDEPSWVSASMFGICMCISSTVVLTRVLADNKALQTPAGHTALGWLVVEDIFTIILLVLLPVLFGDSTQSLGEALWWMAVKLALLILCVAFLGRFVIARVLTYVSRSTSDELFTLAVLVLALGIAVLSAQVFNASLEFGAFLSGMVVGQSRFASRAASDALPMRDAFAVLFFVSVGMGFDAMGLLEHWELALSAILLTLLAKPLMAYIVIRLLRRPSRMALIVSASLSQVGEFSFILAALIAGAPYKLLPEYAVNVITGTAIITITLNAALYRFVPRLVRVFEDRGIGVSGEKQQQIAPPSEDRHRIIVVGFGPCGQIISDILMQNNMDVVIIEMNVDTVGRLSRMKIPALHGDARLRTILRMAGVEHAEAIIITSAAAPAKEIAASARSLKPEIGVMAYTTYTREAQNIRKEEHRNQQPEDRTTIFSGEEEVALTMSSYLLRRFGATEEQVTRERRAVREKILGHDPAPLVE